MNPQTWGDINNLHVKYWYFEKENSVNSMKIFSCPLLQKMRFLKIINYKKYCRYRNQDSYILDTPIAKYEPPIKT